MLCGYQPQAADETSLRRGFLLPAIQYKNVISPSIFPC
ncbi:hypothetical protein [Escherichia coli ISC7]|uniref:Uncharacterized protein n=1 Tax=Escherichia coli ISC7 TaxID=1432555 RepID=W1F1U8_ECOLX|nr:hypothetical protein [Escherichia coli ISC7]